MRNPSGSQHGPKILTLLGASSQVLLSVPTVEIRSQAAAGQIVSKPDHPKFVAVRQDLSGALTGRALLILPEASGLELLRVVVGRQLTLENIVDLEEEALAETANIILNRPVVPCQTSSANVAAGG